MSRLGRADTVLHPAWGWKFQQDNPEEPRCRWDIESTRDRRILPRCPQGKETLLHQCTPALQKNFIKHKLKTFIRDCILLINIRDPVHIGLLKYCQWESKSSLQKRSSSQDCTLLQVESSPSCYNKTQRYTNYTTQKPSKRMLTNKFLSLTQRNQQW